MGALSDLLLSISESDDATSIVHGGQCTEWDATTFENVVTNGAARYEDLAVLNPSAMSVGPVLLLKTAGNHVILGRLHRASV